MNKIVIKFTAIFLAFTLLLGTSEISFHALSTGNNTSQHNSNDNDNDNDDKEDMREKHKRDHNDIVDDETEEKLSKKQTLEHRSGSGGSKGLNENKVNSEESEDFEKKEFVDNTEGHATDLNLYGEESMKNAKALAATKALDISDGSITISKNTADENKIDIVQGSTAETISKFQAIEIKQVKTTGKTTNKISIGEGICTEKKPLNLVLNNVKIDAIDASDNAITIGSNSHVNIVKDGTNTLHGAKDAINAGEKSSVIFSGRGSLTATAASDTEKNGSIYVNGNIRVENGTLNATKAGTTVEGGISAAGTITVLGGSNTKLTAKGTEVGLYSKGDMHINASVVNAASKNTSAISADACVIIDKADANAESETKSGIDSINEDVKISSGNINANGKTYGISSKGNMNLAGGKITANASDNDGICSGGVMQLGNAEIEAHGGTVDAANAVFSGKSLYILGASLKAVAEHGGAVVAAYLNMSGGSIDASGDRRGVCGYNGIDISGGNVQASADYNGWCAAICGGGYYGSVYYYGAVNISGKNTVVNAKASTTSTEEWAHGIFAYGINISGATVKAESFAPYKCRGICSDYYDININADADVNADAKVSAAEEYEAYPDGIYVYCGNVNINANVTANANIDMGDLENPYTEAYGIGAENDDEEDYSPEAAGNITINGGNIKSKVNIASKDGEGLAAAINTGYYDYDAYYAYNGGDITINGGNLDLSCEGTYSGIYYAGIAAYSIDYGDGIKYGGNVNVNAGDIKITADDDGIYVDGDANISGGTFDITAYDDGIYADGDTYISGGTFNITADDDGIYAYDTEISGGSFNITADDEGIDAGDTEISDGTFNITADDDGIYAYYTEISGGTFNITAYDDGIDAGNTNISGGYIETRGAEGDQNPGREDGNYFCGIEEYGLYVVGGTIKASGFVGIYSQGGEDITINADSKLIIENSLLAMSTAGNININNGDIDITNCLVGMDSTDILNTTYDKLKLSDIKQRLQDEKGKEDVLNLLKSSLKDPVEGKGKLTIKDGDVSVDKDVINLDMFIGVFVSELEVNGGTINLKGNFIGAIALNEAKVTGGKLNIADQKAGVFVNNYEQSGGEVVGSVYSNKDITVTGGKLVAVGNEEYSAGGVFCNGVMDIRGGEVEAMSTSEKYGALTSYKQTSALTKLKKLFLGEEGMSFPVTGYAFFEGDTKDAAKVKEFIEPTIYTDTETGDSYYTTGKYVRIVEGTAVTLMVGKTEVGTALALQGSDHLTGVNLQGGSAEKGYYNNENHDKEVAYSDGYFLQEVPGYTDYEGHWNDINSTDKLWVDANKYKIKYSANYGDTPATYTPADVEFTYGEDKNLMSYDDITKVEGNTAFKREGFTFNGWNTKADGSGTTYADKANAGNIVTNENNATVTLYAQWVANTYEVTFHANDGVYNTVKLLKVAYNANLLSYEVICKVNNAFIREGFTFTGWNTKADGKGTSLEDKAKLTIRNSTGKIDLYAQWEEESSTLTYKSEDAKKGSVSLLSEVVAMVTGKAKGSEAIPNKGYSFDGWYDSKGNKVSDNKKLEPKQVGN